MEIKPVLTKQWKIVDEQRSPEGWLSCDTSVATIDGEEVIGSSEWLNADYDVLEYIVKRHNEALLMNAKGNICGQ